MSLYAPSTTPTQRRQALRDSLNAPAITKLPGAFNPLTARLIEDLGLFEGVYVSGAVLANDLGLPDIGLTTLTEVAGRGRQIARATDLPVLIDADTGFGEPMSAARTVSEFEDAGLAGCHFEDQVNPKRCGHLDGKEVVPTDVMVRRISAALYTVDDFKKFRDAVDTPLLANMTEFGKTELLPAGTLEEIGYNAVIYPVTTLRIAMGAVEEALREIGETGTQAGWLDRMQHRSRLYELVKYEEYNAFDQSVFTYSRDSYSTTF